MKHWGHFTWARLCAILAAPLLTLAAAPALAQTVSITSTPANGTHYVTGEAITTRLSGLSASIATLAGTLDNHMRINIGTAAKYANCGRPTGTTVVNCSYTVVAADFDADGITLPANWITGPNWLDGGGGTITRNYAALTNQAAHKVNGPIASISSTTPAALHEGNLNGATVNVTLLGVTFGSGVTTASFQLVTAMTGVSISSVSSVSSGDTTATLTLSSTADISADATLAVRVLAAAHTGNTNLTTGTVNVVPVAASISSTTPATLSEGNLHGATVVVALSGVAFGSGVATSSFELVTTMTGVSISSVSSVSSGDTTATLTLASTADISADATLAVRVLAAAHTGSTALTTGTVSVVPVAASISRTFPVNLGSVNLHRAIVEVALTNITYVDGATASSFELVTTMTGVSISGARVITGNTTAELTLSAPDGVTAAAPLAVRVLASALTGSTDLTTGTVSVTQALAAFSVDSPRVAEGGTGDTPTLDFTVTLSPAAAVQATVDYAHSPGGTATSGTDHAAITPGTLTFAAGETSKTISVTVTGDTMPESDEGVTLTFSNPTPSTVFIASGSFASGIIVDDDTPTLTIDSPSVAEGNAGTTDLVFTVTLSPAATSQVTVGWTDAGEGTAASAGDYQQLDGGTLTFAAGETSKTIPVVVRGDGTVEPDETVRVRIDNATIATGTVHVRGADGILATEAIGVGTIANDDGGTSGPVVAQQPAVILAAGDEAEIDLSTIFLDPAGGALTYSATSNHPEVASATVEGSVLRLRAGGRLGTTEVLVTATNQRDQTASVTISVEVVGTESACSTAQAQAPEGGTATAVVELASAAERLTTVRWHLARDTDLATADADAGDHGGASGEVQFRAGQRCAEIEIDILDDEDVEPAREWFLVVLRSSVGAQLARATIPVAVMEGVCDRTPVVRSALLAATDAASCEAPAPADLHLVSALTLAEAGLDALVAEDFGDLTGLRMLDLAGNGLTALPALPSLVRLERLLLPGNALEAVPLAALPAPERLRELILSNNALSELPTDAFSAAPGLRSLRLDGNRLETLPAGLFAGSSSLRLLRLDGNPGAPFTVRVDLERADAEPWASAPAMLRAVVPLGAPFEFAVGLTAEGAMFADSGTASEATVAGGETAGHAVAVYSAGGFAQVALTVPGLPDRQCLTGPCWQGFLLEAGPPLALFARRVLGDEPVPLFGEDLRVSLSSLAEAGELSGELEWSVRSSDPSLAAAYIDGGALHVEPALGAEGDLRVEVTATDANGQTTTVYFEVRVEFHWPTRSWREIITGEER